MVDGIALIGFMGCGKSTVGKELARRLNYHFIDLDTAIEHGEQMHIPQIFAQFSEQYFRDLEHQYLTEQRPHRVVLSCGGGLPIFARNAQLLQENWCTVFLDCSFEACYRRICHSTRPLVQNSTPDQLRVLYDSRRPLYENCCSLQIAADSSPFAVAGDIIKQLRLHRH